MKKILVIDDEEILIRTYVKLLEKNGYEPFLVKSGYDGVEIVKETDFDLIITDMRMPGMDGVETLQKIRSFYEEQKKSHPPEIVITGYPGEGVENRLKTLQVAACFDKPFDTQELLKTVQGLVS